MDCTDIPSHKYQTNRNTPNSPSHTPKPGIFRAASSRDCRLHRLFSTSITSLLRYRRMGFIALRGRRFFCLDAKEPKHQGWFLPPGFPTQRVTAAQLSRSLLPAKPPRTNTSYSAAPFRQATLSSSLPTLLLQPLPPARRCWKTYSGKNRPFLRSRLAQTQNTGSPNTRPFFRAVCFQDPHTRRRLRASRDRVSHQDQRK